MRSWMPLVLALTLGLAACGDEESAPAETESPAPPEAGETQEGGAVEVDDAEMADEASGDAAPPPEGQTSGGEATERAAAAGSLTDDQAMPGEASSEDVEKILEETDRRFEEAQREIDEQFEEVERQAPEPAAEPTESLELDEVLSEDVELSDGDGLQGSSDPEVQKILEETERRFEEASQKLDEQFEQAEQAVPSEIRESTTGEDVAEDANTDSDTEAASPP